MTQDHDVILKQFKYVETHCMLIFCFIFDIHVAEKTHIIPSLYDRLTIQLAYYKCFHI